MSNSQVVIGTLTSETTILLDSPMSVRSSRVRLTVEPLESPEPRQSLNDFLVDLRRRQSSRGHTPRTAEEIQEHLSAERASWGE